MNGTAQCPHPDYEFQIGVNQFHDTNGKYFLIQGRCKHCLKEMKFRGLPIGGNPDFPTVNLPGTQAHLPFTIGDEIYDGKGIGFGVDLGKETDEKL